MERLGHSERVRSVHEMEFRADLRGTRWIEESVSERGVPQSAGSMNSPV